MAGSNQHTWAGWITWVILLAVCVPVIAQPVDLAETSTVTIVVDPYFYLEIVEEDVDQFGDPVIRMTDISYQDIANGMSGIQEGSHGYAYVHIGCNTDAFLYCPRRMIVIRTYDSLGNLLPPSPHPSALPLDLSVAVQGGGPGIGWPTEIDDNWRMTVDQGFYTGVVLSTHIDKLWTLEDLAGQYRGTITLDLVSQ